MAVTEVALTDDISATEAVVAKECDHCVTVKYNAIKPCANELTLFANFLFSVCTIASFMTMLNCQGGIFTVSFILLRMNIVERCGRTLTIIASKGKITTCVLPS